MHAARCFIRSIFPGRTGWSGSGGPGADAHWLFLPELDTRNPFVIIAGDDVRSLTNKKPMKP